MMKHNKILFALGLSTMALAGCPTDPVPTDAPVIPTDVPAGSDTGGVITMDCAGYCAQTAANCTGANAQYDDTAECMAYCTASGWPAGTANAMSGNTIACRIYHGGVAATDPVTHCPHAGPSGGSVCGASVTFRTEAVAMYDNVDRMGMPAVATALVPSANRNDYNDGIPADDAALMFAGPLLGTLGALHAAPNGLDDDLLAAGLTPCSMSMTRNLPIGPAGADVAVPLCAAQAVAAGGPPVVALVVPDTLSINPANAAGFPNGRMFADPAIDVTLAIILLDLESPTGCGGSGCRASTLATFMGTGLNPATNDRPFLTEFPYLAAAHAAP
jgi:hypothetical protein